MVNPFRQVKAWWLRRKELQEQCYREIRQAWDDWEYELKPLPVEEAKRRAEALLADPHCFLCEEVPPTEEDRRKLEPLSPLLREFFQRYSRVTVMYADDWLGDEWLDRNIRVWNNRHETLKRYGMLDATGRDEWLARIVQEPDSPFLSVGGVHDQNTVLVRPGEEEIYVYGEATSDPGPKLRCATVYHYLLKLDRISQLYRPG
jgi:hypothetical protein